jgi:hypothetical protein
MCAQGERPSSPQCRRLFKRLFMYARCKFSSKKNFIFKFLSLSRYRAYRSHRTALRASCRAMQCWRVGIFRCHIHIILRHVHGVSRESLNSCLVFCQLLMLYFIIWFIYDHSNLEALGLQQMPWLSCALQDSAILLQNMTSDEVYYLIRLVILLNSIKKRT